MFEDRAEVGSLRTSKFSEESFFNFGSISGITRRYTKKMRTLATTYLRDLKRTMCLCSFNHFCSSKMAAICRSKVMCNFRIKYDCFSIILFISICSFLSLYSRVCLSAHISPTVSAHVGFPMYALLLVNVLPMSISSFVAPPT